MSVDVRDAFAVATFEGVVLHVLDRGLDLALLLRRSRWRWVHLEAVVLRQLSVASIQCAGVRNAECCVNHGRLQVVRYDRVRYAAEGLKRLLVQQYPRLRSLVEGHPRKLMTAVREYHHEDPRLAQPTRSRIPQLADVAEVDLSYFPSPRDDGDRHVLLPRTALALNARDETFDSSNASRKLRIFAPKAVVDRCRSEPSDVQAFNSLLQACQARLLLMRDRWRCVLQNGSLERLERRNRVQRPLQNARCRQSVAITPLRM